MGDDANIIGGGMMAASNADAPPSSWSPSRYTRQRRERRRANKLLRQLQEQEREEEELDNEKPKSKTLGLMNRKV